MDYSVDVHVFDSHQLQHVDFIGLSIWSDVSGNIPIALLDLNFHGTSESSKPFDVFNIASKHALSGHLHVENAQFRNSYQQYDYQVKILNTEDFSVTSVVFIIEPRLGKCTKSVPFAISFVSSSLNKSEMKNFFDNEARHSLLFLTSAFQELLVSTEMESIVTNGIFRNENKNNLKDFINDCIGIINYWSCTFVSSVEGDSCSITLDKIAFAPNFEHLFDWNFLSRMITVNMIVGGKTCIIGKDPQLVSIAVNTLALFTPVQHLSKSLISFYDSEYNYKVFLQGRSAESRISPEVCLKSPFPTAVINLDLNSIEVAGPLYPCVYKSLHNKYLVLSGRAYVNGPDALVSFGSFTDAPPASNLVSSFLHQLKRVPFTMRLWAIEQFNRNLDKKAISLYTYIKSYAYLHPRHLLIEHRSLLSKSFTKSPENSRPSSQLTMLGSDNNSQTNLNSEFSTLPKSTPLFGPSTKNLVPHPSPRLRPQSPPVSTTSSSVSSIVTTDVFAAGEFNCAGGSHQILQKSSSTQKLRITSEAVISILIQICQPLPNSNSADQLVKPLNTSAVGSINHLDSKLYNFSMKSVVNWIFDSAKENDSATVYHDEVERIWFSLRPHIRQMLVNPDLLILLRHVDYQTDCSSKLLSLVSNASIK